jgi:exosome complex component RRP4
VIAVENRELVVPGQLLAEGDYRIREGAFREGKFIYSSVVGLVDIKGETIRVIALQGPYVPKPGDVVVGIIEDTHPSGWIVDINSPYHGNLLASDYFGRKVDLARENLERYLRLGDVVALRVKEVNERKQVMLEGGELGLGKLKGGKLVEISPAKVARVLGKKGSMLEVLQKVGGCRVLVGQNGRIMVWGRDPRAIASVTEALLTIEREAHTTGLTDRIRLMLEESKKEVS